MLQVNHVDCPLATDTPATGAAAVIDSRKSVPGASDTWTFWLPVRDSATVMVQRSSWRRTTPPAVSPVVIKVGELLLLHIDCVHAGTLNLATSWRLHGYAVESGKRRLLQGRGREEATVAFV